MNKIDRDHRSKILQLPSRYQIVKKLGSGSYGSVFAAKDTQTNKIVAVKIMSDVFKEPEDAKRILREVSLLKKMDSPYIVKLIDCNYLGNEDDFNTIYIVMEYHKKDLRYLIKSKFVLELADVKQLVYNML
mmetsp:Transcript_1932/g.2423  ORF Transcript_1932/g.2423 Transcript_1932/m.2423 type:complete len:131 (-) Transcript_1932:1139-1531(-)